MKLHFWSKAEFVIKKSSTVGTSAENTLVVNTLALEQDKAYSLQYLYVFPYVKVKKGRSNPQ